MEKRDLERLKALHNKQKEKQEKNDQIRRANTLKFEAAKQEFESLLKR